MELDTGSPVTLITEKTWKHQLGKPRLEECSEHLVNCSGDRLKILGDVKCEVNVDGEVKVLYATVANPLLNNLLGRDWLQVWDPKWPEFFRSIHSVGTKSTKVELDALLQQHDAVFKEELGHCKGIKAKIHLKPDAQPKFVKPRPIPYSVKGSVGDDLDRLERIGVVERIMHSDWAAPIVPVIKPSGAVRICGDFKVTVNPQINVDQYPLPRPEELFASLNGGQQFTKLDFSDAYLQIELDENAQSCLVINTHKGLYRYKRLPFGVSSAPAIFQQVMDQVIQGLKGVACYLDDLLITGRTTEEHFSNLNAVLQRIKDYGFRIRKEKCQFFQNSVEYLGHIIDKAGIRPSPKKVEAILKAPAPGDQSQLRSFLGGVNYFGKFIGQLADLSAPLNNLLKQDVQWDWSKEANDAFTKLKEALASMDVLVHYDPKLTLGLACDASSVGLGAVLFHRYPDGTERPIAYASKTLNQAERNYSQIEREALSIIFGVKKFHQYLFGRSFKLVTDHKPLLAILGPQRGIPVMAASRLQRWALILAGYSYDIEFKPTAQHGNADCLSRLPMGPDHKFERDGTDDAIVCQLQQAQIDQLPVSARAIREATRYDPKMCKVLQMIRNGWDDHIPDKELTPYKSRKDELTCQQGCIMWGLRVIIPPKLCNKVLQELHSAHSGMVRMKALARMHVWWPGIDAEIEQMARKCEACMAQSNDPARAPLHSWEYPQKPWQRLHIDFAGPFMGKMWLIVVDAHSEWPEVIPMQSTTSEKTVSALRSIFAIHGLPEQLVSDNGPQFTSIEFREFCRINGINHVLVAPYHPSSNGKAERFVQTFKAAMNKSQRGGSDWEKCLANFLLTYRITPHATTGLAPSELLMKRQLRTRLDIMRPDVGKTVEQAQKRQQTAYRSSPQTNEFKEGDLVWARNYREGDKWVRATVVKRQGPLTYKVRVNDSLVWKRHVDQLKPRAEEHPDDDGFTQRQTRDNEPREQPEGPAEAQPEEAEPREAQPVAPPRRYPLRERQQPERFGFGTRGEEM
jgi:hypothetical protein